MAKDQIKLEIVNETHKEADMNLDNEIEAIFGKLVPPKNPTSLDYGKLFNGINNESDTEHPSQPLLEPNRNRQLPPLAGPEIDDLDGDPPRDATPYPGIDDGLLESSDSKPSLPEGSEHDGEREPGDDHPVFNPDDHPLATDGKVPWDTDEPDYPYGDWHNHNTHSVDTVEDAIKPGVSYTNGLGTRFGVDDRPISPIPGVIPNVNTYQQKKNLAQGMMDLALLSANANQLRYVLESTDSHPYYYSSLTFISLSIIIQVVVGVGLIMNSRYDVNDEKEICKADRINNLTVLGIFLITIVNVFITSFSVATPQGMAFNQALRANSSQ